MPLCCSHWSRPKLKRRPLPKGQCPRQNSTAEYVLDRFHITMRFTVLLITMKGLGDDPDDLNVTGIADTVRADVQGAKWHLWHGNIDSATELLEDTALGLAACADDEARTKVTKFLQELRSYLRNNRATIPTYAERHRAGEPLSSAAAEATVNEVIARRMVKHRQMRWSPTGAHHILQIRTRTLDGQLDHDINRWHPTAA
jgi:hypothetical protein